MAAALGNVYAASPHLFSVAAAQQGAAAAAAPTPAGKMPPPPPLVPVRTVDGQAPPVVPHLGATGLSSAMAGPSPNTQAHAHAGAGAGSGAGQAGKAKGRARKLPETVRQAAQNASALTHTELAALHMKAAYEEAHKAAQAAAAQPRGANADSGAAQLASLLYGGMQQGVAGAGAGTAGMAPAMDMDQAIGLAAASLAAATSSPTGSLFLPNPGARSPENSLLLNQQALEQMVRAVADARRNSSIHSRGSVGSDPLLRSRRSSMESIQGDFDLDLTDEPGGFAAAIGLPGEGQVLDYSAPVAMATASTMGAGAAGGGAHANAGILFGAANPLTLNQAIATLAAQTHMLTKHDNAAGDGAAPPVNPFHALAAATQQGPVEPHAPNVQR